MQLSASSAASPVTIRGHAEGAFEPLRDIFARMIASQGRGGAALSVYWDGRPAVDLIGGTYDDDSLQLLFSVTKVVTSVTIGILEARGLLDLDAPLSDCWPEMSKSDTATITTRMVLSHTSGLAEIDDTLTLREVLRGADVGAIERQRPYWPPGSRHGYHAFTFGTLLGEVVHRTQGRGIDELVDELVARPLGLELWVGAPSSVMPRIVPVEYEPRRLTDARAHAHRTYGVPPSTMTRLLRASDVFNDPRVLAAHWPSTTGVSAARDLARFGAAMLSGVDGVRLLDAHSLARLRATRTSGLDAVLGVVTRFGTGVQLPFPQLPLLGPGSFGHESAGGSVLAVAPEHGLSAAFTTNVHPSVAGASAEALGLLGAIRLCAEDGLTAAPGRAWTARGTNAPPRVAAGDLT